jgi:RimJ/RimL family protein N-acetyltransferase
MSFLFYRSIGMEPLAEGDQLPADIAVRIWRPADQGIPRAGPKRLQNLVWWAFTVLGVFAGPSFAEITLWRDERLVHRLIVTPRWRRFPFMARGDMQIGEVWTDPQLRGQGLARAAISEAHRLFAGDTGCIWYLTDRENAASRRLIEACGYRLAGEGMRARAFGALLLGQFRLTTSV